MTTIVQTASISQNRKPWGIIALVLLAVFINHYFGTNAVFITAGFVTVTYLLFFKRSVAEYSTYGLVLWFAAGYRAFSIGGGYMLHMLDIIPLLLIVLWIRGDIPVASSALHPGFLKKMSTRRLFIAGISLYGLVIAMLNGISLQSAIMVMKNFLILIPMTILLPRIFHQKQITSGIMWSLMIAGLLIAIPGILEYNLGMFAAGSSYSDGFNRGLFSFWGATMAVLVLTLCFQSHWFLWGEVRSSRDRLLLLASAAIQLYAIYISGTRNIWIAILLISSVALYVRLGAWKAMIAIPVFIALLSYAPEEGVKRMESFYFLHDTDQFGRQDTRWLDSSGADRAERMSNAVNSMVEQPLGRGWAHAGWVHSDILSIGAELGVIPALLFLSLLLTTTIRLLIKAKRCERSEQFRWLTYVGFMITNIMLFSFGGVTWIIQYALPAWFTWLLSEYHLYHDRYEANA
ncbi:MAG: hypothetical protein M5R41_11910 [Bacteroidia bacterium]|nr:hypothetical protein [Bacteroidia bacterium]